MLENKIERLEGTIQILQTASYTATAPLIERLYALESLHGSEYKLLSFYFLF